MIDQYYRKIESVKNNIENAMQISGILLKLKGYDNKLSNLEKIEDNENNISTNSGQISTNTSSISSNLGKIDNNINAIKLINKNSQDNTKDISTNLGKINTNKSDIDEINSNLSNIDFNLSNKFSIENFFIYNIEIEQNYKLDKDKRNFSIFKYVLEDKFAKDSILEIDCRLLYRYHNYNHIGLVHHIFKLYDNNDNMFYNYKSLITNSGDNKSNDLKQNDVFYVKLNDNYDIIKIELILSLINNISSTTIADCKLYDAYKSNFINIKYYKKINLISVNNNLGNIENTILSNSSKIDENKNDISTNLIKINSNEDDILTNLNEINYLKNNKSYLKNVYNILFYDSNEQISFKDEIFYEKLFDVNTNVNDFVEIKFKIDLEYRHINDRNYIKNIYEILDENDNSLYIKSASNSEYSYFSNRVIINEEIFYTFTKNIKKIKFVIKFIKLSTSKVIYLYYIKNDNYTLTIKIMGYNNIETFYKLIS